MGLLPQRTFPRRSKYNAKTAMMVKVPGDSLPKRLAALPMDLIGSLLTSGELLPPFSMRRFVGEARWQLRGEDFKFQGNHLVEKLVQDAGLNLNSRVLDIGSGCGRLAIPMTRVLGANGSYEGLEPVRALVAWCRRTITPRLPNFQFRVADIQNTLYNPAGSVRAEEFVFPFPENNFDLIIATSVFTHVTSKALENYAAQCFRILNPGGCLFASFFLLDNGSRSPDGKINFSFPVEGDPVAFTLDKELPERAVAYRSEALIAIFQTHGLALIPPIRWGCWTGLLPSYSGQDILILQKRAA